MKKNILFISLFIMSYQLVFTEDDNSLNIFGSLQTIVFSENLEYRLIKPFDSLLHDQQRISFAMKQLDLYFNKNLNDNFNVFIDIEMKLNFSTEKNWGDMNLQEAWLKYEYNDFFNLQFGLLNPRFNNLNEIRNRLVLIHTIFRPIVYEGLLSNVFDSEDFVPEKAFIQTTGIVPFGVLSFDYALFFGNGESSSLSNNYFDENNHDYISGVDKFNTKNKLFGGRIGIIKNDETFKTGISFTRDSDNKTDTINIENMVKIPPLGMIPRLRLGFDLAFEFWKFEFLSEYIHVFYNKENLSDDVKMGQQFFFLTMTFNIMDDIYSYATYQFLKDNFLRFDSDAIVFGFGYKINESIVAKTEMIRYKQVNTLSPDMHSIANNPGLELGYSVNYLMAGINVFF